MTYLADVNVLLALAWSHHPHHNRARAWWAGLGKGEAFATCAVTELGFVRISLQPVFASADIGQAKLALAQLRTARPGHVFLADTVGADALPPWVKSAQQTTDGHLAALAAAHGAKLATLDAGIPGALLIVQPGPDHTGGTTQSGYGQPKPDAHEPPLLFRLPHDPSEKYNVAADHTDVLARIAAAVAAHRATLQPVEPQLK